MSTNFPNRVLFKKLHSHARMPVRATPDSVGYDLCSCGIEPIDLSSGERKRVSTGLSIALPTGYWAKIEARSGLAIKHGIFVPCGIIDTDYRGPLDVVLMNGGSAAILIEEGMKIAQLILYPLTIHEFVEVKELPSSYRGEGGFGSTGA